MNVSDVVDRTLYRDFSTEREHGYPTFYMRELRAILADREGLSESQILIGAGSDSLLVAGLLAAAREGFVVGLLRREYKLIRELAGFHSRELCVAEDLPTLDKMAVGGSVSAIFLSSPNYPTGEVADTTMLQRWAELGIMVVVDEAYIDYVNVQFDGIPIDGCLHIRTMSKREGRPDLRIGWMFGSSRLVGRVAPFILPFPCGSESLSVAARVLRGASGSDIAGSSVSRLHMLRAALIGLGLVPANDARLPWIWLPGAPESVAFIPSVRRLARVAYAVDGGVVLK